MIAACVSGSMHALAHRVHCNKFGAGDLAVLVGVHPVEHRGAAGLMVGRIDLAIAIAVAFGEMFLWGTKSGQSLKIQSNAGMIFPSDYGDQIAIGRADSLVQSFLASKEKKRLDQKDDLDKPLFDRAAKALGPLAQDEMYGFEPALALGGKADLRNLRKVKAVEHLVMLAQLGERQVMRDIVKDAKAQGLM